MDANSFVQSPLGKVLFPNQTRKLKGNRTFIKSILALPCYLILKPVEFFLKRNRKFHKNAVKTSVSRTALEVAAIRYHGTLCGFINDPFSKKFLPIDLILQTWCDYLKYLITGIVVKPFLIRRTCFFDEVVKNSKPKQLVILGAGFDCRAHRIDLPDDVKIFEVDALLTIAEKKKIVNTFLNKNPRKIHYVAVDFSCENFYDRLIESGFDPKCSETIFTLEGVSRYLKWEDLSHTMKLIATSCSKNTLLCLNVIIDTWSNPEKAKKYPEMVKLANWSTERGEETYFGMDEDLETPFTKFLPLGFSCVDVWIGPKQLQLCYPIQLNDTPDPCVHMIVLTV